MYIKSDYFQKYLRMLTENYGSIQIGLLYHTSIIIQSNMMNIN